MRVYITAISLCFGLVTMHGQDRLSWNRCDLNADCIADTIRYKPTKASKTSEIVIAWGKREKGSAYCDSAHYEKRKTEGQELTSIVVPGWDKRDLGFSNLDMNNDGFYDVVVHVHGRITVGKRTTSSKERNVKRMHDTIDVVHDTNAVYILFAKRDLDQSESLDVVALSAATTNKSARKMMDDDGITDRRPSRGGGVTTYALVPVTDAAPARAAIQPTRIQENVEEPFNVQVNPNPVTGSTIEMRIDNSNARPLTFAIVNDGGRIVLSEKRDGTSGPVSLDVSLLSSGTYQLVVTDDTQHRVVRRFAIVR
ncbi:MAG: T9SS type A sorting domain-containing protein [bacterium]|nr:T9SS type A sorting domain-containing protein [bacterium]